MKAMIIKEFRELARDRRTLVLLVALPILLLTIFGYAANFTVEASPALVVGPAALDIAAELDDNPIAADQLRLEVSSDDPSDEEILHILRSGEHPTVIRAISSDRSQPLTARTRVWTDGSKLFSAQAANATWMRVLSEDIRTRVEDLRADLSSAHDAAQRASTGLSDAAQALDLLSWRASALRETADAALNGSADPTALRDAAAELSDALATIGDPALSLPSPPDPPDASALDLSALDADSVVTIAFNPDLKTSWVMIPGLIGLILTFIGTIVTAIGLVREREAGTLEQLAVMPLSPASIILGKVVPYFLIALLDAGLITALGTRLFRVPFTGSIWAFALLSLVFVFVVLGLGILVSSASRTTGQAIQMSIMVMIPQTILSGFIFPLENMPMSVRWIGYCLPLTWFYKAANTIFLTGASFEQILVPLAVLTCFAAAVFGTATARMAVSLRHGGAMR
ncbi:ABC transporter permease [Actinomyces sp. B33]|uniref:ABC transporter permease n=1 Tax=Actinomyces sp. B33 TaxID=2942131 RepID=UPI002340CE5E|nr:ABC transporter permease [Actinomyces sp. B33]MDC4233486.1 ABC transporter permease [Actinomyces sp. B33]